MKKQFIKIANAANCTISKFASYRSDMGCQVYEIILLSPTGIKSTYDDAYFVGEEAGKRKVLEYFKKHIQNLLKK